MKLVVVKFKKIGSDVSTERLFLVKTKTDMDNFALNNYLLADNEIFESVKVMDEKEFFEGSNCGLLQLGDI